MERDREYNQRNDILPIRKPRIKNLMGQKNRERTPPSDAVYRTPRIRALDRLKS